MSPVETPDPDTMPADAAAPSARCFVVYGQKVPVSQAAAGLHVVATPIGNLKDITLRALTVLAGVDAVLAEDTRVTRRLLDHYGIQTRLIRHDAHATPERIAALAQELHAGARYALVSDAGTPLLSDPGLSLARAAADQGVAIHALPGASALLAALVSSTVPADRFFFEGFLPQKGGERRRKLRDLGTIPGALVVYEAPHRIVECLADMIAVLGDRQAAAARELTKLHEEIRRGALSELHAHFEETDPRGEFVLIVAPAAADASVMPDPEERLRVLLAEHSVKDAAAILAGETGLAKRDAYARALKMAQASKEASGRSDG